MNTGIVNDALKLCLNIFNAVPPNDSWAIVNIAKTTNDIFTYPNKPEIPTSFGYVYDNVPKFLKTEGVIEAWTPRRWFLSVSTSAGDTISDIALVGRQKKYLNADEFPNFYYKFDKYAKGYSDFGPADQGQYSILINKQALIDFYVKYSPPPVMAEIPSFNVSSGELYFLGENIKIEGEVNIKTMDLLIRNINSRIGYKDLYEVRASSNYDLLIQQKGKTPINDIVEKVFKSLKASIEENPKIKSVLVFVQKDGFGIFIDRNAMQLLLTPQKTPQKQA